MGIEQIIATQEGVATFWSNGMLKNFKDKSGGYTYLLKNTVDGLEIEGKI